MANLNLFGGNNAGVKPTWVPVFHKVLDQIYVQGAVTSVLESTAYSFNGTKEVKIFNLEVQGLGDIDADDNYPRGAIKGDVESYRLRFDRAVKFEIRLFDAQDAFGGTFDVALKAFGEMMRIKTIPEFDASRIAGLYENAGIKKEEDLNAVNTALALDEAVLYYRKIGYPIENLLLFINPIASDGLEKDPSITRRISVDVASTGIKIEKRVNVYKGLQLLDVPVDRLNSKIKLNTVNQDGVFDKASFTPTTDSKEVNFILVPRGVAHAITRHQKMKFFSSEENHHNDNEILMYRVFYDLLVPKNQRRLIYASVRKTKRT